MASRVYLINFGIKGAQIIPADGNKYSGWHRVILQSEDVEEYLSVTGRKEELEKYFQRQLSLAELKE